MCTQHDRVAQGACEGVKAGGDRGRGQRFVYIHRTNRAATRAKRAWKRRAYSTWSTCSDAASCRHHWVRTWNIGRSDISLRCIMQIALPSGSLMTMRSRIENALPPTARWRAGGRGGVRGERERGAERGSNTRTQQKQHAPTQHAARSTRHTARST